MLLEPAVLTHINQLPDSLKLEQASLATSPENNANQTNRVQLHMIAAQKSGIFDLEIRYELPVFKRNSETGFFLPIRSGLINRLSLSLINLDVDVVSPQAVSTQREEIGSNTVASLVLSAAPEVWVGWKPRSRNVRSEEPVFYAEITQLYAPTAGVIEGEHLVSLRLAQGELNEVVLDLPAGVTITDVLDPTRLETVAGAVKGAAASMVCLAL